jgi:hypothetical protein
MTSPHHHEVPTMSTVTPIQTGHSGSVRELAHRRAGDLDVWLLWSPADDAVSVQIYDRALETRVTVAVDGRPALEVFHHPFAYARVSELAA